MHWFLKFIFRIKLYKFRTVPLSIITKFLHCTHNNGMCHTSLLAACEQDQDGIVPARKLPAKLYDIYHCCVYSEKNSWWWIEELYETCRVLFQK